MDFCPCVWGRSGLGAYLNLRGVCVGLCLLFLCEKEGKKVWRGKVLKTVEGHRLGKSTVHNKASGLAVLLGQGLR